MSSNRHNSADRGSPESSQIPIRKQSMELTDTCSSSRSKELKERSSEGSGTPRNSAVVNDGVVNDSVVHDGVVNDAVFGTIENGRRRPNYRNVGWIRTSLLMMKAQVGVGALSIPGAFNRLGLVPGVMVVFAVAIVTTWSNQTIGHFKLRHPDTYGLDDVGGKLFGPIGREVFFVATQIFYIFVAASALLTVSTCLNALTDHAYCTALFVAVAAIAGFFLASPRTLSKVSWLAWVGMVCILTSIFTLAIAVCRQDRPAAAPPTGPWKSDFKLFGDSTFIEAMSGVSSIIFAFTGTPYFFPIVSEMREPKRYFRAMYVCQSVTTTVYLVIGGIVYYKCGSYVTSPALGSAGDRMKKVSYAIALPGLLVSTMIVCHLPAKNIVVRLLRGSRHLTEQTLKNKVHWYGCCFSIVLIAYVVASAIPVFSGLISLIGALLGSFTTMQPYGAMWLLDNWQRREQHESKDARRRWFCGLMWAFVVIAVGSFCTVVGSYASVVNIIDMYRNTAGSAAWSCADNSGSA